MIFLFIAAMEERCARDLSSVLGLCKYLGVPIATEKNDGSFLDDPIRWNYP